VGGYAGFRDIALTLPGRLLSRKGSPLRLMEIEDHVIYRGRRYVLRGLDPMSVDDRRALLEDAETGEQTWVPLSDLEPDPGTES